MEKETTAPPINQNVVRVRDMTISKFVLELECGHVVEYTKRKLGTYQIPKVVACDECEEAAYPSNDENS